MTTKTEEEPKTFEHTAPLLGEAYREWKEWEGKKNGYKTDFFELADEAVHRDGLALKLYEVVADDEATARKRAELHNPGWLIDELRAHRFKERLWEIILREDPSLMPFSFEHEGVKYARQVSKGAVMIDDEYLAEQEPALYTQVTYELPWGAIIMLPIEQLPKVLLVPLQKYMYNARPRVSLAAPRQIKPEE